MKRLLLILLVIGLVLLAIPTNVYGIADPTSPPQIRAVYVYEDCLADGDVGVLVDYYLDYAVLPSETATESFLAIFIDTDGTTQLQSVAPYTFQDSGYGRGLIWIYFTPAEVVTHSIDSANELLYTIWLTGNPTLSWPGDPPKTTAGIDYWQPSGTDTAVLVALRVLYYADQLELIWSVDMIEVTALGNRLSTIGASYFENVITNLRTMAPAAFSAGTVVPELEDLDYSTGYGAIVTDDTGTVVGSPITLTEGSSTITVSGTGNITFTLSQGTSGNVTDGTGTVTGSPVDVVAGTNTVTATGVGTLTVDVNLIDTQTSITDIVLGTGFDLTTVAAEFGMSRLMFSGLVWLVMSIVICAAVYRATDKGTTFGGRGGSGKIVMIIFDICIIGGALLGLLSVVVAALLFIAFGVFTGYVLFFRSANV